MGAVTDRRKDLLVRLISTSPSFPGRTDLIYTRAVTGNPHPFLKKHFHPADTLPATLVFYQMIGRRAQVLLAGMIHCMLFLIFCWHHFFIHQTLLTRWQAISGQLRVENEREIP